MSLSCFRINTYTSVDSKGLTAMYCFGALALQSPAEPASESGRYSLPQKRKCGNLVAAAETLPGCSRSDYSKIWFGFKEKRGAGKNNVETQSALRFGEKSGWVA